MRKFEGAAVEAVRPEPTTSESERVTASAPRVPAPVPAPAGLRVQRKAMDDSADGGASQATPYGVIVDDGQAPGPGQITRTSFMDTLGRDVRALCEAELAKVGRSALGCPYIDHWLAYYRGRPARELERAIRTYAAPTRTTAADLADAVVSRVRAALRIWTTTGKLTGIPEQVDPSAPDPGLMVQAKSDGGPSGAGTADPVALRARLTRGQPLETGTRTRMEHAFGRSFDQVRVHTDPESGHLARSLSARAFTVGTDIAFAPGQYRPSTPGGDGLLAHELAHTVQQSDASRPGADHHAATDEVALEGAADRAAAFAVARAYGLEVPAPALPRSGLGLRRCGSSEVAPRVPPYEYDAVVKDLAAAYARKQGILTGATPTGEQATVDQQIDDGIAKMRELGVRADREVILQAVTAGTDLRKVGGKIVQSPAGDLFPDQRVGYEVMPDYIPVGGLLEYEWTWTIGNRHAQFAQAPGRGRKGRLDLAEGWWFTEEDNIRKAGGFEIFCNVYVGAEKTPSSQLRTGLVKMTKPLPEKLTISPDLEKTVVGATIDFNVSEWAMNFSHNAVVWEVNGKRIIEQPNMKLRFPYAGTYNVKATLFEGERNWGKLTDRKPLRTAERSIEVQEQDVAGQELLDQMALADLPALPAVRASMDTSLAAIDKRVAQGGEQKPYWEKAKKQQNERRERLDTFTQDFVGATTLPADAADVAKASTYSGPVPAVLVLPRALGTQPLSIYLLVRHDGTKWQARLIDATGELLKYDGSGTTSKAAYEAAFETWRTDNPYPMGGRVVHGFAPTGWSKGKSFGTTTTGKRVESWIDTVLTVGAVIVAGLLMMGGAVPLALGLVMAAATIARSSYAIYKNYKLGIPLDDRRNVLEGLAILTSFMGVSGSAMRQIGIRAVRPVVYRVGNWVVLATIGADAGTLVYATTEAVDAMRAIDADPTIDEGARAQRTFTIIAGLIAQGSMFILSNKDLFKGGLKRSDFFPTDPEATTAAAKGLANPELEMGARLDIAVELKKAGDPAAALAKNKLSDRDLIDRYMGLGWLKGGLTDAEIALLLPRLSTDSLVAMRDLEPAGVKKLVEGIGDDAVTNALAPLFGGERLRDILSTLGAAKLKAVHDAFGGPGVHALVEAVGQSRLATMLISVNAVELKGIVDDIGVKALANLTLDLSAKGVGRLVKEHGKELVKWAGDDLRGADAKAMLKGLDPAVLTGLKDIPSNRAKALIEQLGKAPVEQAAPHTGGEGLERMAKWIGVDATLEMISKHAKKPSNLADTAAWLKSAESVEFKDPQKLGKDSVIVDSNVNFAEVDKANNPAKFAADADRQVAHQWLTDQKNGGADVRVGPIAVAEVPALAGAPRKGFKLTVERTDPAYRALYAKLTAGNVGGVAPKGAKDRTAVADAFFADVEGGGPAKYATSDTNVVLRCADLAGLTVTQKKLPGGKMQSTYDAIVEKAASTGGGFEVDVDGKKLFIVPVPHAP